MGGFGNYGDDSRGPPERPADADWAVLLLCFCRYADMLTPYMNSVPAVIAKASAIHNPIIYAITHPKYR